MLTLIKRLSKGSALIIAILVTAVIVYLSLANLGGTAMPLSISDKLAHAIAYLVLTGAWLLVNAKFFKTNSLYIITGCIAFGILLEILQVTLTSYRTFEVADAVANTVGVFLGMLIFNQILKKNTAI